MRWSSRKVSFTVAKGSRGPASIPPVSGKNPELAKAESDRWQEVIEAMQKKTMAPRRLPKEAPIKPKGGGSPEEIRGRWEWARGGKECR
jgi:hypothetical protein